MYLGARASRIPGNTHDRKKIVQATNPFSIFGILINEQSTFATNRAIFFLISSNATCTYVDCILLAQNPTRMYIVYCCIESLLLSFSDRNENGQKWKEITIELISDMHLYSCYLFALHSFQRRSETNSQHTQYVDWFGCGRFIDLVSLALHERVVWMRIVCTGIQRMQRPNAFPQFNLFHSVYSCSHCHENHSLCIRLIKFAHLIDPKNNNYIWCPTRCAPLRHTVILKNRLKFHFTFTHRVLRELYHLRLISCGTVIVTILYFQQSHGATKIKNKREE